MPRSRRKRGRSRPFSIKAAHPLRSSRVRRSFVRRHRIRRSQHPEFATAVLRSRSALPEFRRSQTVSIKTATRETGSVSNLCQNFFRIFFLQFNTREPAQFNIVRIKIHFFFYVWVEPHFRSYRIKIAGRSRALSFLNEISWRSPS
jgi:hypothetical protein